MRLNYNRLITISLTLLVLFGALFSNPIAVQAGGYIVVTTVEDKYLGNGNCSLREAIIAANENHPVDKCPAGDAASMDTIYIPAGNYFLQLTGTNEDKGRTGDLDIRQTVLIHGAGIERTKIDADQLNDRVFHLIVAGSVYIKNLTIKNGFAAGGGGGILNAMSSLYIQNTLLDGNKASNTGGNIDNASSSYLVIDGTTISGGSASHGGGIFNNGIAVVRESLLVANQGTTSGGGIDNNTSDAALIITNSTIGQNTSLATDGGAGIFSDGLVRLTNTTIAQNLGEGIKLSTSSSGWIVNTIIAGNSTNCEFQDEVTTMQKFISKGHNLEDQSTCVFMSPTADKQGMGLDAVKISSTLGNNGGPTQTYALLAGSPAIDGGTNTNCPPAYPNTSYACPLSDQRLMMRPWDGNGDGSKINDIGAYEYLAPPRKYFMPTIRK